MELPQTSRIEFLIESFRDQLALGRTLQEACIKLRAAFKEEEINQALEVFKEKHATLLSRETTSALVEKRSFQGWYAGPNEAAESHWSLLKTVLRNKERAWTNEMIESLDQSSSSVLSYLVPPLSAQPIKTRGLVLGYVQSGKTANFSALIAKAVDAGYRLIVVLSGVHNNLRLQTQTRLHEELVAPKESAALTLTRVDANGDFQKSQAVTGNQALGRKSGFTLVVLKKNSNVLSSFNSWISKTDEEVLKNCPTLVIDDESDQASINTNKADATPTAINNRIRTLINNLSIVSYVGYTATPFANVLIDSTQREDLYPRDFLICLDKPKGYFGPEELFGREDVNASTSTEGLPVIRNISPADLVALGKPEKANSPNTEIVGSLRTAIDSFILSIAARTARGQWRDHMTMLVHTSHLIAEQEKIKRYLESYIQRLKLDASNCSSILKNRLMDLWKTDFAQVTKKFHTLEMPAEETLWSNATKAIEQLEIIIDNSASSSRLSYTNAERLRAIVVGGNTLSRGLTLEGLLVSYFARSPKTYDTLLQMGRWFGYRPGYVDLTRIFVGDELQDVFFHLATVEEEIRQEVRVMAANGDRPIDVALRIRTHPGRMVTASNKMRTAGTCFLTYSGSKIQARHIDLDEATLRQNLVCLKKLLDANRDNRSTGQVHQFSEFGSSILYRGVPPANMLDFLSRYSFSPRNGKFSSDLLSKYIKDLNKSGELTDWSIAIMSASSGHSVALADCITAFTLERSVIRQAAEPPGPNIQLRSLSASQDELVDLSDVISTDAKSAEAFLKESDNSRSGISVRRKFRPKTRGLMIVHPLDPHLNLSPEDYSKQLEEHSFTVPLKAADTVLGITFVFPFTDNSRSQHVYIANESV